MGDNVVRARNKKLIFWKECAVCYKRTPEDELVTQRGVEVCRDCIDEYNPRHPEDR